MQAITRGTPASSHTGDVIMDERPLRSVPELFNISFGFFGIQTAFALQNANVSRIFQSLGASMEELPILWIAAPLTGLLVQPLVGHYSDRTWLPPFGRRRPYFCLGAFLSGVALLAMPHAHALWVAAALLWVLDASINIAMEPFRAFVGDLVGRAQRTAGYAFQTVFIGAGAVAASLSPLVLHRVFHVTNEAAADGGIPASVRVAFYAGAAALCCTVLWTVLTTTEYPPAAVGAPPPAAAPTPAAPSPYAGRWLLAGIALGTATFLLHLDRALYVLGACLVAFAAARRWTSARAGARRPTLAIGHLLADLDAMPVSMRKLALVQFCSWSALFILWIYTTPTVTAHAFGATGPGDPRYAAGADWVGVLFAVYNGTAALAAFALPAFAGRFGFPRTHQIALLTGAAGFAGLFTLRDPLWLLAPMVGIGVAWAGILTLPYAMLCSFAPRARLGAYMGLFNLFITLPQMLVAAVMGAIMRWGFPAHPEGAMVCAGLMLVAAAAATQRLAGAATETETETETEERRTAAAR